MLTEFAASHGMSSLSKLKLSLVHMESAWEMKKGFSIDMAGIIQPTPFSSHRVQMVAFR